MTDKMKRSFFQASIGSILIYGCTTWTLTKRIEKKFDSNYTRMLEAAPHEEAAVQPFTTDHENQVRRTRHAEHCWRSRDEVVRDVLLWILSHRRTKAVGPARTYIQQLCVDTGCSPEDLSEAMDDRKGWLERARDTHADGVT